jgi:hypothetical protein
VVTDTDGIILIGNIGYRLLGVADGPGGVVEIRIVCRGVGGDADPPALIENQLRAEAGGVEGDFSSALVGRRDGLGMIVRQ